MCVCWGEGVSWNIVLEAYIRRCVRCWVGVLVVESVFFGVSFCSLALLFFVDFCGSWRRFWSFRLSRVKLHYLT